MTDWREDASRQESGDSKSAIFNLKFRHLLDDVKAKRKREAHGAAISVEATGKREEKQSIMENRLGVRRC